LTEHRNSLILFLVRPTFAECGAAECRHESSRNDRVRSTQQVMQSVTSCDFAIAILFARVVGLAAACPMGRARCARVLVRRIDIAAPANAGPARSRSDFFVSLLFSLHLREITQREITKAWRLMVPIARGGRRCPRRWRNGRQSIRLWASGAAPYLGRIALRARGERR
jgi:hypothetical protein